MNVVVAQSAGYSLDQVVREAGLVVSATVPIEDLQTLERSAAHSADVLILDVRGLETFPMETASLKRRYPKMGILLVAAKLDMKVMLEAMRAGVTEVVTDPVSAGELRVAVQRLAGQLAPHVSGEVLAFIGAKGGVGTTTLAVNVASALAVEQKLPVALVELHMTSYGDAALLVSAQPRFSVADALENVGRMDEAYIKGVVVRTALGVDMLAAPDPPLMRAPEPARVKALLQRLIELYRWVVVDVGPGDLGVIEALEPVSAAVTLVVTQDVPAVRLATNLAGVLAQHFSRNRLGIVINRFDSGVEIGGDDVQKAVGLPLLATVPVDYKGAVNAANVGKPVVSDSHSRMSPAIKQMAGKLATAARPDADKSTGGPKIVRFAGLF